MMPICALQGAGLSVPDDIAVMGVDDLPLCEMIRSRLTSVSFGWAAADILGSTIVALLRDEPRPETRPAITCTVLHLSGPGL